MAKKKGVTSKRKHASVLSTQRKGHSLGICKRHGHLSNEAKALNRLTAACHEHQQQLPKHQQQPVEWQAKLLAAKNAPDVQARELEDRRARGMDRFHQQRQRSLELQQQRLKDLQAEFLTVDAGTLEGKHRLDELAVMIPAAEQGLANLRRS